MAETNHEIWRRQFENWSSKLPRGGVLVTDFDQIVFVDFRISDDFLFVERTNPDVVGARSVLIPFSDVRGVKFIRPIEIEQLEALGFRKSGPAKAPTRQAGAAAPRVAATPARPVPGAAPRPAESRPAAAPPLSTSPATPAPSATPT